jgi:hypothetical protein
VEYLSSSILSKPSRAWLNIEPMPFDMLHSFAIGGMEAS